MAEPMQHPCVSFALDRAQDVVDGIPEDRRVVLLGESTHGTEEFYRIREAVTKRLIEERGFTAVLFEADWPAMQAATEFAHRRRGQTGLSKNPPFEMICKMSV
jgi:erythromycin esterase-like protein